MNFGKAIELLKEGKSVARNGWGERMLGILEPGRDSKMTLPFIFEATSGGETVPYAPSHQELLADDWEESV